ncbi:hypothetical protein HK098_000863 [Nowakowskiella sp. JEL0407]|nr:hypothetical protein HK098_000863 [Nowakowskiella sp. JEL0407]
MAIMLQSVVEGEDMYMGGLFSVVQLMQKNIAYVKITWLHSNVSKCLTLSAPSSPKHVYATKDFVFVLRSNDCLAFNSLSTSPFFTLSSSSPFLALIPLVENSFLQIIQNSVNFYTYSKSLNTFALKESILRSVIWHLYSVETQVLLICSPSSSPFLLYFVNCFDDSDNNVVKGFTRFEELKSVNKRIRYLGDIEVMKKKYFSILLLYNKIYLAHTVTSHSKISPQILLYRITKSRTILEFELEVTPGNYILNVVDNLLIASNTNDKNFFLFDIRGNPRFPIYTSTIPTTSDILDWQSHYSKYIFSPNSQQIHRIILSIPEVLSTLITKQTTNDNFTIDEEFLIGFLIRREESELIKKEIKVIILKMMMDRVDPKTVRGCFDLINFSLAHLERYRPLGIAGGGVKQNEEEKEDEIQFKSVKMRLKSNSIVQTASGVSAWSPQFDYKEAKVGISCDEINELFKSLYESGTEPRILINYIIEFICSAHLSVSSTDSIIHTTTTPEQHVDPPDLKPTSKLLTEILLATNNFAELTYYLSAKIIKPSYTIAKAILKASQQHTDTSSTQNTSTAPNKPSLSSTFKATTTRKPTSLRITNVELYSVGINMLQSLNLNFHVIQSKFLALENYVDAIKYIIELYPNFIHRQATECEEPSGLNDEEEKVYKFVRGKKNLVLKVSEEIDETLFLNMFLWFEGLGDGDDCLDVESLEEGKRFLSVYREMWGDVVVMEEVL